MHAFALTYPALQRRFISQRRSRALFLSRSTRRVTTTSLPTELARAALALGGVVAWCAALLLIAR